MTQSNQSQKNDDFKLAIVFRIEGHNSRSIILRFAGIVATLLTIAVKLTLIIWAKTH